MKPLIFTAALLACLAPSAFAQTTGPVNSSQMDAASSNNDQTSSTASSAVNAPNKAGAQQMAATQKITQDLQNAGFTDVKVVAESFVIEAKSKDGDPVLMTIGPHGMSLFEAMSTGTASGTVGQGSDRGGSATSGTGSLGTRNPGTQQ